MTGTSEFNEVFFDGAHARAEHVVGGEGRGWQVAMSLLGFERGVSTLSQQVGLAEELTRVVQAAVQTGAVSDPVVRALLVRQWAELRTMRWNALRTLGGSGDAGASSVAKLLWAGWAQRLGGGARVVRQWAELRTMRWNALRTLGGSGDAGASSVAKLLWAGWHQRLGELAMLVRGGGGTGGAGGWCPSSPCALDAP